MDNSVIRDRVVEWNKSRDNNKFVLETEFRLFMEEKYETEYFYTLYEIRKETSTKDEKYEYLAEIIDGYCDICFVAIGSDYKAYNTFNKIEENKEVCNFLYVQQFVLKQCLDGLRSISGKINSKLIEECIKIVCDINDLKGNKKDINGKIIKGDIPKAQDKIKELLKNKNLL